MFIADRIDGRLQAVICCALAGGLLAFSMPPWGWWPCAFAGVAFWERSLAGQATRTRFARGFGMGVAFLFPATVWMWDLTIPGYVFQGLLFAVLYGLVSALVPAERGRRVAIPAALVLAALVRWNWPFGGVPIATLAMSQADAPLGQTARVFGSLTIVALVGVAGVGVSLAVDGRVRHAAGCLGLLLIGWGFAELAPDGRVVDTLDIAIVQGGGPQNTRAVNTSARDVFERHIAASGMVQTPVDLVMWPENVVLSDGPIQDAPEYAEMVEVARRLDAPLIPGIVERYKEDNFFDNASIVITPDGETTSRYDKVRRVPFGEYVPFRSIIEIAAPDFLPSRDARPGTGPAYIDTEFGRFAISISWEVFHDDRTYEGVNEGGLLILNPTNGSSYWLTVVQSQQIASSRLRAIENGRWVLQAAPTGFSAIVEPDGSLVERTAVSEARVLQGTVELRTGRTWATILGPWPMIVVMLALFAAAYRPRLADFRS